jgi:hypothetical protein
MNACCGDNAKRIGLEMYQSCGAYNTPDMVTIGQGAETDGQYRAQMFLWSVFGAPILLGMWRAHTHCRFGDTTDVMCCAVLCCAVLCCAAVSRQ